MNQSNYILILEQPLPPNIHDYRHVVGCQKIIVVASQIFKIPVKVKFTYTMNTYLANSCSGRVKQEYKHCASVIIVMLLLLFY